MLVVVTAVVAHRLLAASHRRHLLALRAIGGIRCVGETHRVDHMMMAVDLSLIPNRHFLLLRQAETREGHHRHNKCRRQTRAAARV